MKEEMSLRVLVSIWTAQDRLQERFMEWGGRKDLDFAKEIQGLLSWTKKNEILNAMIVGFFMPEGTLNPHRVDEVCDFFSKSKGALKNIEISLANFMFMFGKWGLPKSSWRSYAKIAAHLGGEDWANEKLLEIIDGKSPKKHRKEALLAHGMGLMDGGASSQCSKSKCKPARLLMLRENGEAEGTEDLMLRLLAKGNGISDLLPIVNLQEEIESSELSGLLKALAEKESLEKEVVLKEGQERMRRKL